MTELVSSAGPLTPPGACWLMGVSSAISFPSGLQDKCGGEEVESGDPGSLGRRNVSVMKALIFTRCRLG